VSSIPTTGTISLPAWADEVLVKSEAKIFKSNEERMRFTISLARENIEKETGGPFAAAIFEQQTGKLVSAAMNCVTSLNWSGAHAEVLAIFLAQVKLQHYLLRGDRLPLLQLVTSVEPCVMCLGAIHWSHVPLVLCGATKGDAEEIGFDEGPRAEHWKDVLKERGIAVQCECLREEARGVLQDYKSQAGVIY